MNLVILNSIYFYADLVISFLGPRTTTTSIRLSVCLFLTFYFMAVTTRGRTCKGLVYVIHHHSNKTTTSKQLNPDSWKTQNGKNIETISRLHLNICSFIIKTRPFLFFWRYELSLQLILEFQVVLESNNELSSDI